MKTSRHYSALDQLCLGIDQALRSVFGNSTTISRNYPASNITEPSLTEEQRRHSAALMRINHAGEVCAQALYHGQGLVSRCTEVREKMQHAAMEEGDHLAWCQKRLMELGSHTSYLNPVWYTGSFFIGITAGLVGDKWSLGFLAETESQVVKHLENQMSLFPTADEKSQHILRQMQEDEMQHREDALRAGGVALPWVVKKIMGFMSGVMINAAYWV